MVVLTNEMSALLMEFRCDAINAPIERLCGVVLDREELGFTIVIGFGAG